MRFSVIVIFQVDEVEQVGVKISIEFF